MGFRFSRKVILRVWQAYTSDKVSLELGIRET